MPPEIINNNLKCGVYSDIWSLGCVVYDMIYGSPPFHDKTEYLVFENINNLKYSFPQNKYISEDTKDFIASILKLDPSERISGNGNFSKLKSHSFFNDFKSSTILDDLKYLNPTRPRRYSTANQILTINFNGNSISNKKSSKSQNAKKFNSELNMIHEKINDHDSEKYFKLNKNRENKVEEKKNVFDKYLDKSSCDHIEEKANIEEIDDMEYDELDEHKEVYIPSQSFDVRIPKNISDNDLTSKLKFLTFDKDLLQNKKYVSITINK